MLQQSLQRGVGIIVRLAHLSQHPVGQSYAQGADPNTPFYGELQGFLTIKCLAVAQSGSSSGPLSALPTSTEDHPHQLMTLAWVKLHKFERKNLADEAMELHGDLLVSEFYARSQIIPATAIEGIVATVPYGSAAKKAVRIVKLPFVNMCSDNAPPETPSDDE